MVPYMKSAGGFSPAVSGLLSLQQKLTTAITDAPVPLGTVERDQLQANKKVMTYSS